MMLLSHLLRRQCTVTEKNDQRPILRLSTDIYFCALNITLQPDKVVRSRGYA